jgi:hypothetical protein
VTTYEKWHIVTKWLADNGHTVLAKEVLGLEHVCVVVER